MAHSISARKRIRQNQKRALQNKDRMSRMRTFLKKVEEAIESKDKTIAQDALKAVQPELMRAASRNLIHKKTASRKVSRLAKRVKALG